MQERGAGQERSRIEEEEEEEEAVSRGLVAAPSACPAPLGRQGGF